MLNGKNDDFSYFGKFSAPNGIIRMTSLREPCSMASAAGPPFLSRIVLPIACERLERPPTAEANAMLHAANAGVLEFLLHGLDAEATARPLDDRLAEALTPIRAKLDMIITMVGRLSYRDVTLPPARAIEFRAGHLVWASPRPLRASDWVRLTVYFHPTFLEPVRFFARVGECAPAPDGGYHIEAELAELPETVTNGLARLAFVAQRRQQAQRSAGYATKGDR
jgi:hypothetical protein